MGTRKTFHGHPWAFMRYCMRSHVLLPYCLRAPMGTYKTFHGHPWAFITYFMGTHGYPKNISWAPIDIHKTFRRHPWKLITPLHGIPQTLMKHFPWAFKKLVNGCPWKVLLEPAGSHGNPLNIPWPPMGHLMQLLKGSHGQ